MHRGSWAIPTAEGHRRQRLVPWREPFYFPHLRRPALDESRTRDELRPMGDRFRAHRHLVEMGSEWLRYLARSQYLLRKGALTPMSAFSRARTRCPVTARLREDIQPNISKGYDYDFCDKNVLPRSDVGKGRADRASRRHELSLPGALSKTGQDGGNDPRSFEEAPEPRAGRRHAYRWQAVDLRPASPITPLAIPK